jgi:hypothetical protein
MPVSISICIGSAGPFNLLEQLPITSRQSVRSQYGYLSFSAFERLGWLSNGRNVDLKENFIRIACSGNTTSALPSKTDSTRTN